MRIFACFDGWFPNFLRFPAYSPLRWWVFCSRSEATVPLSTDSAISQYQTPHPPPISVASEYWVWSANQKPFVWPARFPWFGQGLACLSRVIPDMTTSCMTWMGVGAEMCAKQERSCQTKMSWPETRWNCMLGALGREAAYRKWEPADLDAVEKSTSNFLHRPNFIHGPKRYIQEPGNQIVSNSSLFSRIHVDSELYNSWTRWYFESWKRKAAKLGRNSTKSSTLMTFVLNIPWTSMAAVSTIETTMPTGQVLQREYKTLCCHRPQLFGGQTHHCGEVVWTSLLGIQHDGPSKPETMILMLILLWCVDESWRRDL